MPKKLKHHILNYIRFIGFYFIVGVYIEAWQQNIGFEHYWLIESVSFLIFISITVWFIYRAYIGIYKDGDFFMDD